MAGREIIVRRVGNVLSGYLTRTSVVILSTLACRKNKKAWISFMGCGIVWSLAEMSIVLSGNRAGPMTLEVRNKLLIIFSKSYFTSSSFLFLFDSLPLNINN